MFKAVGKLFVLGLAFVVTLVMAAAAWVYFTTYHPDTIQPEPIVKIVGSPLERVNAVTRQVAGFIRSENPDVILLQELDEGSARTYFQDQLLELLALLPNDYVAHTSSYYWKADFVPHPEMLGAIGMKLSIISKYKIENATRYALSEITNQDILERQFNAKRAVLGVELPIAGGGKLNVLNTHLSAFAQHTDTMERQVSQVIELFSGFVTRGEQVLMGGDFNLVPSMSAYRRLSDRNKEYYNPLETELAPLLARFPAVPSLAEADGPDHAKWYTHMGNHNHSKVADKTIDYIFFTEGLTLGDHYVRSAGVESISDHLPVVAYFTVPQEL